MDIIVKVQRPIASNSADAPWLIYEKGATKRQLISDSQITEATKLAMGDDHKGYFKAKWYSTRGWVIGDRIEDQDW